MNLLIAQSLPTAIETPGMMFFFSDNEFLSFTNRTRRLGKPSTTDRRYGSINSAGISGISWTRQA